MASSPASSSSTASRWWTHTNGIAVGDLPHPERAQDAGATCGERSRTIRCPRHGHHLPCDPCAVRDREASTAGWVIGLLGLLVGALLALSRVTPGGGADALGPVAVALTLLCLGGAVTAGLLVAQTYGGEPIGIEVECPACGWRFVWPTGAGEATCPECRGRMTMEQGQLAAAV